MPDTYGIPTVTEHEPRSAEEIIRRSRQVEARLDSLYDERDANQREYESLTDSIRVFESELGSLRHLLAKLPAVLVPQPEEPPKETT